MKLVQIPAMPPRMTIHGSPTGPVIDAEAHLLAGGRVYLSRTDVWQAAQLMPDVVEEMATELGWAPPALFAELKSALDELGAQLEQARAETAKVVSLDDARALLRERDEAGAVA